MRDVRSPAVAGLFYPDDPVVLAGTLRELLTAATEPAHGPKALIVPHAGYVYSGPVAASAYRGLHSAKSTIRRVVLLGPSHRVALSNMAVPAAMAFDTPLGRVPLDRAQIDALLERDDVHESDAPHRAEHALEVQLPFLQAQLGPFDLVPVAVGACRPAAVADLLDALWGGPDVLIVVSSDLSHFHPYSQARAIDAATRDAIVRLETTLTGEQACGCYAVNGLLLAAKRRGLDVTALDLRNSGDTAGDRQRVVGYGAFAIYED